MAFFTVVVVVVGAVVVDAAGTTAATLRCFLVPEPDASAVTDGHPEVTTRILRASACMSGLPLEFLVTSRTVRRSADSRHRPNCPSRHPIGVGNWSWREAGRLRRVRCVTKGRP